MFFNEASDVERIASKCGAAVFVVPENIPLTIRNAILLQPEGCTVISIEQVKSLIKSLSIRQTSDRYIIIRPAELMNEEAANALLKNLEEPKDRIHFILVTDSPSQLLPTILSRTAVYFMRTTSGIDSLIAADDKVKDLAKKLMVARGEELVAIAEEIAKKKDGVRKYALDIIGVAIEMLYKTYFITEKPVFLNKLPGFLAAYEAISKNGHVKLQIVANLC